MKLLNPRFKHPLLAEGSQVYALIKSCPPLDVNSQYYYHILCRDFRQTCVIAEIEATVVGFISAYRKPENPNCLFIWQVAVAEAARGQKLASTMLQWLIEQPACRAIQTIETTISPSNQASQRLFKRFAIAQQAVCTTSPFLTASDFGDSSHEEEILYQISPLKLNPK